MKSLLSFVFFCFIAVTAFAQTPNTAIKPFGLWLEEFKTEAQAKGIARSTLDQAFANTAPIARIIELDRKQPESKLTFEQYQAKIVTSARVQEGQDLWEENEKILTAISAQYGVQPEYILALWGIETGFGANTGGFNIINALATLAYDGRRSAFFRDELLKALTIVEQDHIAPSTMRGSWAGAMGQCQFMPSSFLLYAVDYTHEGHPDIWSNRADVFASIANYLSSSGWNDTVGWGAKASLPESFDSTLADINVSKSYAEWQALGVRSASGDDLPNTSEQVFLILVGEGTDAAPYLVTGNYKVLLKWNRSRYFATSVGMLAEKIAQ